MHKEAYGVKIDLLIMQWIYQIQEILSYETAWHLRALFQVTTHLTAQSIKDLVEAGNQDELTYPMIRKTLLQENVIRSLPLTIWISIMRKSVTRSK